MNSDERRQFRLQNYHAEIKHAGSDSFITTTEGIPSLAVDYLESLNAIRHIVYPELDAGIRIDKSIVVIRRA